jgi:hypothetical protein
MGRLPLVEHNAVEAGVKRGAALEALDGAAELEADGLAEVPGRARVAEQIARGAEEPFAGLCHRALDLVASVRAHAAALRPPPSVSCLS